MKVASVTAAAVSLFFSSAYAGAQGPVTNVPGPSTGSDTFKAVSSDVSTGKLITPKYTGSKIFPRYEIRKLQTEHADQFSLYILAMQKWQAETATEGTQSSYYGISKIHGLPAHAFNGATGGDSDQGYCTHNSPLFPSWHRVYTATFEQQLLARAKLVVDEWKDVKTKANMTSALNELRMPYWDWAASPADPSNPGPAIPDAITSLKLTITLQDGSRSANNIDNPLATYNFPGADSVKDLRWAPFNGTWLQTERYPSTGGKDAVSQVGPMNAAWRSDTGYNLQQLLQDQVYGLLTQPACGEYRMFSNDQAHNANSNCSASIEGIHNTVHAMTGGPAPVGGIYGGHMQYLPLAAYDPLFWLHHANVDRIFALWQTKNPIYTEVDQPTVDATFTYKLGTPQGAQSDLTPFLKDANTFWKSYEVKEWDTTFGYTYPEYMSNGKDVGTINTAVYNTYGPGANGNKKRSLGSYAPAGKAAAPSSVDNAKLAPNGSEYLYYANIQTPRYALKSSFSVYIFLGEPASEEPSTWLADPNIVGPFGVPSSAPGGDMVMAEVIIAGTIPLTRALHAKLEAGVIASMDPDVVNAYLKANLAWKVAALGVCVDPTTLDGFVVSVTHSTATIPADPSQLPVYSTFHIAVDVTADIAGGLNATSQLLGEVADDLTGCVTDVVDSVAKGDVSGVVSGVVDGVKDTLGSLTSGLANIGKAFSAPHAAAPKAQASAASY